ncbi:MAG: gliding motility lipoprotein GldH [Flavobacteriaceae bacterium]|nr:gliding motility lipoprotein GldH [Flavobacteriaceae bacterium]
MRNNLRWIFIILLLGFISCDSNRIYDEYITIPDSWQKDNIITFNITPPDTIKQYNLFINIRNANDYKYSNLFLIVEMNFPNGRVIKDTLEYKMAKPNGELLGKGFTDIKENKLWYKEGVVFNESGEYKVNIQHAMRENGSVKGVENLEGITDVGFRIEKTQSKN